MQHTVEHCRTLQQIAPTHLHVLLLLILLLLILLLLILLLLILLLLILLLLILLLLILPHHVRGHLHMRRLLLFHAGLRSGIRPGHARRPLHSWLSSMSALLLAGLCCSSGPRVLSSLPPTTPLECLASLARLA